MSERDRLAALLHDGVHDEGGFCLHDDHGYRRCVALADRLIAAGVVLGNVTSTDLDVERLARALEHLTFYWQEGDLSGSFTVKGDGAMALAEQCAAAYREDA